MTGVQETSCKLCLETVTVKGFEVIDNVTRDILDVLLLKLKLDSQGKEVICNVCRSKLNAAFEFKSTFLKKDYAIIPYVGCEKMLQLDIRDVCTKEKASKSMDISDSQKICRLCMHPVESEFRCIREEELEAIEKLAPEMNINIIKDPVVCKECFDSVCTHNSFLKNCREVQEKIGGIFNSAATESRIDTSPADLFVKTENQDIEFDINGMEMSIKAESIDIKSEDEERSDSPLQSSDSETLMKSVLRHKDPSEMRMHRRRSCNYKTKNRCELAKHQVKHKSASEGRLYECDISDFKTKWKFSFNSHYIKHKNSNNRVECDFKTKYTALPIKDTLQLPIYKCNGCTYESKNKRNFTRHQLLHKDPSQVRMYSCNDCDYKTKYKSYIKSHQLQHRDPSQVQLYGCNNCDYETKYKGAMKKHQLIHKDPSQVQTYRCNDCDYETKYKSRIKQHQLQHKDTSQIQMYKCNDCDFETKYKSYIKSHQLQHRGPSQVQLYGCNNCDYETKYKGAMKKHQLKHKDPSQVQTYRCNDCDYETKYKSCIKRHQLKHKDPSQVQMYGCNDCDFETKYKSCMKWHQLTHKESVPTVIMNPNAGAV